MWALWLIFNWIEMRTMITINAVCLREMAKAANESILFRQFTDRNWDITMDSFVIAIVQAMAVIGSIQIHNYFFLRQIRYVAS